MYTECPCCQTLFRISQVHLEQADGKVRCSCCEQVFDAREQLRDLPASMEEKSKPEQLPVAEEPKDDSAFDELVERLVDIKQESTTLSSEPNRLDADTEESIYTLQEAPALESLLSQENHKPRGYLFFWLMASLLAFTVLLLQLAWSERMQLIKHPYGVKLLNTLCQPFDCQVPRLKDSSKIKVVSRNVSSHPEIPNTLLLQLTIISDTPYDQPYPQLQLNLFKNDYSLVASRTFMPMEYLPKEALLPDTLMPAGREITIAMELVDPGEAVTGFKLEFF